MFLSIQFLLLPGLCLLLILIVHDILKTMGCTRLKGGKTYSAERNAAEEIYRKKNP